MMGDIMPRRPKLIRKGSKASTQKELRELIDAARKQPGVAELMDVYQQCQVVEQAATAYQKLFGVKRIVSLSDGSRSIGPDE
jgi:hypothetical protein